MISKILRADGTEITSIKSVVYTETVNAGEGLRPGCVASASINVEVFGSQSSAPASGEELTYYQVDASGNETLIGVFYAEPSIPTRNTIKFIAYDAVAKLDKVFSERLNAIQSNFPMTIYDIVSDACSYAGVTLASNSWPLSTQTVEAFYADGLTCRNILQYAAELAVRFVRCNSSGEVLFDWYATGVLEDVLTTESSVEITSESEEEIDIDVHSGTGMYRIYPSSGTDSGMTLIAYKQDGLLYDNFTVVPVDVVAIQPTGTENVVYTYPTGADVSSATNPLLISDNLLLTSASQSVYVASAKNIYDVMTALPTYRHATINLFTGENPFRAGEFVYVTDSQGVSFTAPVFEMVVQASSAQLRSSGNAKYEGSGTSTSKALANISSNIVKFTSEVVFASDLTDGETVISGDNILTGTISADRIDATNLTVNAANVTGTLDASNVNVTNLDADNITTGTIRAQSGDSYWDLDSGDMYIAGAISESDLSTAGGTTINGANISTGTITATQIASNTITANEIKTATITANEIAGNTITAAEIASNAINTSELAANAVTTAKIAADAITADKIATGAVTADAIEAGAITADKIAAGALTADKISLYGKMGVYTNSDLDTNGGYIGYMSGQTGSGTTTNGIAMTDPNSNNYLIITDSGIRLSLKYNGSYYSVYFSGGNFYVNGGFISNGTTISLASPTSWRSALGLGNFAASSLSFTAWEGAFPFRADTSIVRITLPASSLKTGSYSGTTVNWSFAQTDGTSVYASITPTSFTRDNQDTIILKASLPSNVTAGAFGIAVPRGNFTITVS